MKTILFFFEILFCITILSCNSNKPQLDEIKGQGDSIYNGRRVGEVQIPNESTFPNIIGWSKSENINYGSLPPIYVEISDGTSYQECDKDISQAMIEHGFMELYYHHNGLVIYTDYARPYIYNRNENGVKKTFIKVGKIVVDSVHNLHKEGDNYFVSITYHAVPIFDKVPVYNIASHTDTKQVVWNKETEKWQISSTNLEIIEERVVTLTKSNISWRYQPNENHKFYTEDIPDSLIFQFNKPINVDPSKVYYFNANGQQNMEWRPQQEGSIITTTIDLSNLGVVYKEEDNLANGIVTSNYSYIKPNYYFDYNHWYGLHFSKAATITVLPQENYSTHVYNH